MGLKSQELQIRPNHQTLSSHWVACNYYLVLSQFLNGSRLLWQMCRKKYQSKWFHYQPTTQHRNCRMLSPQGRTQALFEPWNPLMYSRGQLYSPMQHERCYCKDMYRLSGCNTRGANNQPNYPDLLQKNCLRTNQVEEYCCYLSKLGI